MHATSSSRNRSDKRNCEMQQLRKCSREIKHREEEIILILIFFKEEENMNRNNKCVQFLALPQLLRLSQAARMCDHCNLFSLALLGEKESWTFLIQFSLERISYAKFCWNFFSCCWIVFRRFHFLPRKRFQLNYNLIFTIMFIYQEAASQPPLLSSEIWIFLFSDGREEGKSVERKKIH